MLRAIIELLVTIAVAMVARAVLASLFKGVSNAAQSGFRGGAPQSPADSAPNPSAQGHGVSGKAGANPGGDLHKDPVCGTYVAESTKYQRQVGGQTFFYCSGECREKHALVAR